MEDKRGARAEGTKYDIWQLNSTRITLSSTKEYNPMNDKKDNYSENTQRFLRPQVLRLCLQLSQAVVFTSEDVRQ
jgi:hypothetical protein